MEFIDAAKLDGKTLNSMLKKKIKKGGEVTINNSHSMHNIGSGMTEPGTILVAGSTGFYTGGFLEGSRIEVRGDAGWYAGDNMMAGELIIRKNSGCNAGSYMYGGTLVIYGGTGSRPGYGMKGGTLLVCGDAGRWAGQMTLGGRLIILGKVAKGIGESMYKGVIYVREAEVESKLGSNCFVDDLNEKERSSLAELFAKYHVAADPSEMKAIRPMTSGRHNYVLFEPELTPEKARKFATGA
jgi:glutamate synthase domain-containing protein 3